MRWFWIDRFIEFRSGQFARAIKNVSLAEEQIDDYVPGYAVMPHSLIVEGLAQAGGLLVGQTSDFRQRIVLAKISRVKFHSYARPGDSLIYEVTMQSLQVDGALIRGTVHLGDELHAEADLYFGFLDPAETDRELFGPVDLLRMLRCFRLFEVAVDAEGRRLEIPPHMLQAELVELGRDRGTEV